MPTQANNRTALVTGANKGIGFETARQLARQSFHVLLGARDEQRGNEAAAKLKGERLSVEFVKLDVTSEADRTAVARHIAEKHGGKLSARTTTAGRSRTAPALAWK